MDKEVQRWIHDARSIETQTGPARRAKRLFCATLQFVGTNGWQGACHASSAVLVVLFRASGTAAEPYLGECFVNGYYFDHSWVEVEGEVYDLAISLPLLPERRLPPVFRGKHVDTKAPAMVQYGVDSGEGYDRDAERIKTMSFRDFMDNFPHHEKGLWGVAEHIAKAAGSPVDARALREQHSAVNWRERRRTT